MNRTVHSVKKGQRFATDTSLRVVICFSCKMHYAIPESLYKSAMAWPGNQPRGWKLFCPLGHEWWYTGRSLEQELEDERDRAARIASERDQARASARAHRGAATRARNQRDRLERRAVAGVCPCCTRTFKNAARHMASQHPHFAPGEHEDEDHPA